MARLFVAILPPATVQAELAALAAPLPGMRWTPAANLHLTMRFIGDSDDARLAAIESALAQVRVEPFILPVAGLGLFPARGPAKVLWAGLGHSHTRLFQLRKQVDEALLRVDPGLDVHRFHPHFTLGRPEAGLAPKLLANFLARHAGFEAPPFLVDAFHLLASAPVPGGAPVYTSLRAYPLRAR